MKTLAPIIVLVLIASSRVELFSQSVRTGEIQFTHLSGFTYEFNTVIYTNDSTLQFVIVMWGDGTADTLHEGNSLYQYSFSESHTFPGIGTYVVSATVNFLMNDIVNIQNAGTQPFYLEDSVKILDPAFFGYNNSPIVMNPVALGAYTQQTFLYNPIAFDPDGDSLSFSLAPFFATGYTFPDDTDSITVNSFTGELAWDKPILGGNYAVAILMKEWRSGVVIGTELLPMVITVADTVNQQNEILIFPNPFTTSTTITLTRCTAPFNVQLFDELGREAPLQFHSKQQGSRTVLTIDRGSLPSGMYFLSITSKEKREVVKVMVE